MVKPVNLARSPPNMTGAQTIPPAKKSATANPLR
jgi:hypothetical protein